jgi:hypothetical protein
MVAGAALTGLSGGMINPLTASMIVGGFEGVRTGDLGQGLMAGLGAYGGAGLGQGLAAAGGTKAGMASGAEALGTTPQNLGTTEGMTRALTADTGVGSSMGINSFDAANIGQTPLDPTKVSTFADAYTKGANPETLGGRFTQMGQGIGQLGTEGGRAAIYNAMPTGTLPSLGATALSTMTPETPPIPGMPEEEERYKGSPYRYNLSPNFRGFTPATPDPYYRPTGLGYAEGGDVKKKEEAIAAPQPRSELGQNFLKGMSGQPGLKSYQVTDPMTQALPYMMGAKMRSIMPEEIQDKMATFLRPAAAPVAGNALDYEIDPRTGQIYTPRGLGYDGYAAGGMIDPMQQMPNGGLAALQGMRDGYAAPQTMTGNIPQFKNGGSLEMKRMSLGEGIARDTDTDTASLSAYDAAQKRLEKQFAAANLKPTARPKSRVSKLGEIKTGIAAAAGGSIGGYSDGGRMLKGPGDGMSDSIPATIGKRQPARLADGEFVVPADVVSHLGNGSTDAGAKRLYAMMDKVRKARTGKKKQAPAVKASKYMPA